MTERANEGESEPMDPPLAAALEVVMSSISEDAYAAGWMQDLEYDLWAIVVGDAPVEHRGYFLTDREQQALRTLSEVIDGWHDGEHYVPMSVWKRRYAARRGDS